MKISGKKFATPTWRRYGIPDSTAPYVLSFVQRNGIILYEESAPQAQTQSTCPLFTNLPTEIRQIVFRILLTTPQTIEHAHKQLGSRDTAMLDQYVPHSLDDLVVPAVTMQRIFNERVNLAKEAQPVLISA